MGKNGAKNASRIRTHFWSLLVTSKILNMDATNFFEVQRFATANDVVGVCSKPRLNPEEVRVFFLAALAANSITARWSSGAV